MFLKHSLKRFNVDLVRTKKAIIGQIFRIMTVTKVVSEKERFASSTYKKQKRVFPFVIE